MVFKNLNLKFMFLTLATLACTPEGVFFEGEIESKTATRKAATNQGELQPETVLTAEYSLTVESSNTGGLISSFIPNPICTGTVTINLASDMKFNPQGTITCAIVGEKDVAEMLGTEETPREDLDPSLHPESGKIGRKANPVAGGPGARFDPPMPFIIGPLIQNPQEFAGYRYQETSSVTYSGPEGQVQDSGAFLIEVLGVGESLTTSSGLTYDNIIHWQVTASGFNQVPRGKADIFQKKEWWWNTRPISIPKLSMVARLSDLMPDEEGLIATLGDSILGNVTITISLINESR
jgi:hypothetical protein